MKDLALGEPTASNNGWKLEPVLALLELLRLLELIKNEPI
jgi:hypothetical protein